MGHGPRPWHYTGGIEKVVVFTMRDGLNAYLRHDKFRVNLVKRMAYYCAYGAPHPQTTDLISMFPFIKYHYLVPELARPEAFVSKIEPIDEQMFIDAVKHLSEITPDDQVTAGISHLWFLAHSDGISDIPEYLRRIQMWATEVTSNDSHAVPGVKPHPRERNESFLASIASIDFRAVALPHQMPADIWRPALVRTVLSAPRYRPLSSPLVSDSRPKNRTGVGSR